MRIWKARLNLICKDIDNYDLNFTFEQLEENYRINDKFNEWIYSEGWIAERVPMGITISTSYGNISAIQGFNYELNQEELKDVEMNMRKLIKEKLDDDMKIYKRQYEKKLSVIKE